MKQKKSTSFKFLIGAIIFYSIFFIAVGCYFLIGGSKDKDRTQFCYDYKGIFTDIQITSINNKCISAQDKYDLSIFVVTCGRSISGRAEMYGRDFIREISLSVDDDCAVIIINATDYNQNYHFDIYTFGTAENKISEKEIDKIIWSESGDLILTDNSNYATQGACELVDLVGFSYSWLLPKTSWKNICIGSCAISAIIALIVVISIRKSYTRKRKNQTYSIANNSKLALNVKTDNYLRSTTTSVRIRTNDGPSSGGGISFGGRSFGGGGGGAGHRGGR